jgi:hypothetical protein
LFLWGANSAWMGAPKCADETKARYRRHLRQPQFYGPLIYSAAGGGGEPYAGVFGTGGASRCTVHLDTGSANQPSHSHPPPNPSRSPADCATRPAVSTCRRPRVVPWRSRAVDVVEVRGQVRPSPAACGPPAYTGHARVPVASQERCKSQDVGSARWG